MADNEVSLSVLHPTHPALNNSRSSVLMKHTMSFESIVRRLSHEHLCDTQLNISLGKD
jgi:hypothetical protein